MRSTPRLLLAAMLAGAILAATPAVWAQSQDNTAVATNTKDGKSVFKLAFSVKKVTGDVDAQNTAVAYSSCEDCRTVAVAIQVVLVSGDVGAVTPENEAVAVNFDCTECETLARAFQFVFGDGQEIEFTKAGKQRLHDLKKRVQDLKHRNDLSIAQLNQELTLIAREVADVVQTETQPKQPDNGPSASSTTSTTTVSGMSATTTSTVASTTTSAPPATTSTTAAPSTTTTTVPSTTTTTSAP